MTNPTNNTDEIIKYIFNPNNRSDKQRKALRDAIGTGHGYEKIFSRIEHIPLAVGTSDDDYINIRVPKRGDVPIISIDGNLAYSDTEGLESIKFVWATKDHRDTELFIPFVDVRILSHDNQNNVEYVRLATGNETAAEIQRETVNAKYRVKHIRPHDNDLQIRPEVSE